MAKRNGAVRVATTRRTYNGKVYETHLLRRSFREDGKVKHQTLANLSHLPADLIDLLRQRLKAGQPLPLPIPIPADDPSPPQTPTATSSPPALTVSLPRCQILRSWPHGHVAAVLHSIQYLQLDTLLGSKPSPQRQLLLALITARLLNPKSKLATARGLKADSASSSLFLELGLNDLQDRQVYAALDWLQQRQTTIETRLARRHLADSTLLLYDVSSSFYTGRVSGLVQFGYNRDGKNGCPQIVYGLICDRRGCPLAIEVFAGNTSDSKTLAAQIDKARQRFGVKRLAIVGDRGMITTTQINESLRGIEGLSWISALRADSIKRLAEQETIERSLFDERDLAEIQSPDFPGERLIACRNPLLAEERSRKREDLLQATERELETVARAVTRENQPLRGKAEIGLRVGAVLNQRKVGKHFILEINDQSFGYRRDQEKIAAEAALDGIYVVRTSVEKSDLSADETVGAYKSLAQVERAFRSLKQTDLRIRPIYHRLDDRIKAHVFLCVLSYYVEWHMRQKLAPVLFDDERKEEAARERESIVRPAKRSETAKRKEGTKRNQEGQRVHSLRTLLEDLGTITKNLMRWEPEPGAKRESTTAGEGDYYQTTEATGFQRRVFELLEMKPPR